MKKSHFKSKVFRSQSYSNEYFIYSSRSHTVDLCMCAEYKEKLILFEGVCVTSEVAPSP